MVLGCFPGIYAMNMVQNNSTNITDINKVSTKEVKTVDNGTNVGGVNNDTNGTKTIYVTKDGTDRNENIVLMGDITDVEIFY